MKKFQLTDDRFEGNVLFGYSDFGTLIYFKNNTNIKEEHLPWWLDEKWFPKHISQINETARLAKCKVEELPEDLSFDVFWKKYGKKINKIRCEPLWNKMSDAKKLKCLKSIDAYKSYLLRNPYRGKLDPENYLKNQSWDNNWNAEI